MIIIRQVVPTDDHVVQLVEELNKFQIALYGIENCNLEPPDSLMRHNAYMLGAFSEEHLVGIGAIKIFDAYAEVKRMFVKVEFRGLSVAKKILHELERHALQKGIPSIYLETGNRHHAAIQFYQRQGYRQVDSFGVYVPNPVSIYFGKKLQP